MVAYLGNREEMCFGVALAQQVGSAPDLQPPSAQLHLLTANGASTSRPRSLQGCVPAPDAC